MAWSTIKCCPDCDRLQLNRIPMGRPAFASGFRYSELQGNPHAEEIACCELE